jgi:hypothetical protein
MIGGRPSPSTCSPLTLGAVLISMFFEIGENSREKFYIEYLVQIYLAVIAYRMLYSVVHKWKASLSNHTMVE